MQANLVVRGFSLRTYNSVLCRLKHGATLSAHGAFLLVSVEKQFEHNLHFKCTEDSFIQYLTDHILHILLQCFFFFIVSDYEKSDVRLIRKNPSAEILFFLLSHIYSTVG